MDSDRISFDLNDLDGDFSEAANDLDFSITDNIQLDINEESTASASITLESILNEDDDLENDEILRSLSESLTIIKNSSNETEYSESSNLNNKLIFESSSINVCQQSNIISEKNGDKNTFNFIYTYFNI